MANLKISPDVLARLKLRVAKMQWKQNKPATMTGLANTILTVALDRQDRDEARKAGRGDR